MKKRYVFIIIVFLASVNIFSQDQFTKFSLSGYKVRIITGETFKIDIKNNSEAKQEVINGDVFRLAVLDQRGRVPKDTITIYTPGLTYLDLHNCVLDNSSQFVTDSLKINMAASFGKFQVDTKFLSITVSAGSSLEISGSAQFFECISGAGAKLNAKKLLANEATVDVRGAGSATINAVKIVDEYIDKGHFKNIYNTY